MTISKTSTKQSKPVTQSHPTATAATLLQGPPDVTVPTAPTSFDPANAPVTPATTFPRKEEIAALDAAISELEAFSEYAEVLGKTAPPATQLIAALTAALKWSLMLASAKAFTSYVQAQTGVTWQATRLLLEGVKAPFQLASARDQTLVSKFPALVRLLGAAKVIAAKGAAVRKANSEAKANGGPPVHGKAGRRLKAAMKVVAAAAATDPPTTATTSEGAGSRPRRRRTRSARRPRSSRSSAERGGRGRFFYCAAASSSTAGSYPRFGDNHLSTSSRVIPLRGT